MPYTHVLLDLDHTLLDTDTSLEMAFAESMTAADADPTDQYQVFNEINQALWRQVEAQTITPPEVHVTRFEQLNERLGLGADPQAMADAFAGGMGQHGDLYPGARDMLITLSDTATLAMITNGLGQIQRARIERLDLGRYLSAITISGEVGCSKPGTEIFDITCDALGAPNRTAVLMVGDSLASDIQGGSNAGIDTCWYNPHAKPLDDQVTPTYVISDLSELPGLVQ